MFSTENITKMLGNLIENTGNPQWGLGLIRKIDKLTFKSFLPNIIQWYKR